MSGSSLDGLDLALCTFTLDKGAARPVTQWSIEVAETIAYPADWKDRLRQATSGSGQTSWHLHADLGTYIGKQCRQFIERHALRPELIGCHGHTVFHEPANGFSVQLGDGARIAALTGLPVVTELRSADIAAGGQGAPLAPVADHHLFPDYAAFLNLGGIANFSLRTPDGRLLAGDVTGCCQVLDRLAALAGQPYDSGGQLARSGQPLPRLAEQLDALPYHHQPYPKSLSNQWVIEQLWPLLAQHSGTVKDRLHTFTTWLAGKITRDMRQTGGGAAGEMKLLVSGGGARNTFLVDRFRTHLTRVSVEVAEGYVGDFKEAALIALCALFREQGLPNSLASATGARHDTVNGALHAA